MVLRVEPELVTIPGWSDQNPSLIVQLNSLTLMFFDLLLELGETERVIGWGSIVNQESVVVGKEFPGLLSVSLLGHLVEAESTTS